MIKTMKPLNKLVCGPRLHLVGADGSIISNGHWAVSIERLIEGALVKSEDYVRAYLNARLETMPVSSFARMLAHSRGKDKPLLRWHDTGWRNRRGNTRFGVFSTLEMPEDRRSEGGGLACFDPVYLDFFRADCLWGSDNESVFTDAEDIESVSFVLMPVRADGWIGPLIRLFKEHPELA
jgi:hypothetical protein